MQNAERVNPLVYLFQKTWKYSEGNRNRIVLFWIMFIIAISLTLFVVPLVWAEIINVVTLQGITTDSFRYLCKLLAITLVIEIMFWCLHGPARVLENVNAFKARANYRKFLLRGVMSMPVEWQVDHHSGDTIDRVEKGTSALFSFSEDSFQVIYTMVQLIGCLIMIAYFSTPLVCIVIIMIFASAMITMRFDKRLIAHYQQLNRAENGISESVFDTINKITTVIILRVERIILRTIANKIDAPLELFAKNNALNEMKWFLTSICSVAMTILVLGTYFWQHIGSAKGILVGSVYLLINYLEKLNQIFYKFTNLYGDILQRKAKVNNAEEIAQDFKAENEVNHVLPKEWNELKIEGLSFSYHDTLKDRDLNLNNISLSIHHGERIALVGKTGSGKTTLLKIIRDLYHPISLKLTVDGIYIPNGFAGICQAISLVPQAPEIFSTTILENITLGAEYDMGQVKRCSDMACFAEVVEGLPKGFETSMKEKGINLSGGQQQRLALARGLLACEDKDIILLDEPTKSLDTVTEISAYRNIFAGFPKQTIIAVEHRTHLLPMFDRICLFDKGRIIAIGTLKELLADSAEFQDLWQNSIAKPS